MWEFVVPPWELAFRAALIYIALVVALRVFGKREVGQFTLFDLVLVLLVANAVQPAMTGPDTSLGGGLVIIATLLLVNRGVALAVGEGDNGTRDLFKTQLRGEEEHIDWIESQLELLRQVGLDN